MDVADSYINFLESQFKPNTVNCGSTAPDYLVEAQTTEPVFSCPSTGEDATFEFIFSTVNGYNNNISFFCFRSTGRLNCDFFSSKCKFRYKCYNDH
jgi:hypothetical protein